MSARDALFNRNKLYYQQAGAGQLEKDAAALGRLQRAYTDPNSRTRGSALASAMRTLSDTDSIAGVQGSRIKSDAMTNAANAATRQRLSRLTDDDLNDELKRMEAMMPRRL